MALIKHFLDCSSCTSDGTGTVVLRKNLINVQILFFFYRIPFLNDKLAYRNDPCFQKKKIVKKYLFFSCFELFCCANFKIIFKNKKIYYFNAFQHENYLEKQL